MASIRAKLVFSMIEGTCADEKRALFSQNRLMSEKSPLEKAVLYVESLSEKLFKNHWILTASQQVVLFISFCFILKKQFF